MSTLVAVPDTAQAEAPVRHVPTVDQLLEVDVLRRAAERMRANTAANLDRVRATYGTQYANGWAFGRNRAADALDEDAHLILNPKAEQAGTSQLAAAA